MGVKRSRPPRKIPGNALLNVLPQIKKNNIQDFQNKLEVHRYFYVLKRERERERARARAKARAKARVGKGKGKKKEREGKEREREREKKAQAVIFPNRPSQSEISVNYTVLYRKEQYSMYVVHNP